MKTRAYFPVWLSMNGYENMAEIGVLQGAFSEHILKHWQGSMVLVDSWRHFEEDEYVDMNNLSDEDHEKNYQIVLEIAKKYPDRTQVVRDLSTEAAKLFPDRHFDAVYLDANHSYHGLMSDLKSWVRKVKKDGAVSGHDYIDGHVGVGVFNVRTALKDFFGREPNLITHEAFPTWVYYL